MSKVMEHLKNRERWHDFFQGAEVDILNHDSYRVVVSEGPLIVPNQMETPLLILTPEQYDLWEEIKPYEPTKTVNSDI